MRIINLTITLLIYTSHLFAQQLSKDSLIGTWKVINCQLVPDAEIKPGSEGEKTMKSLAKEFINTKFHFGSNGKYSIETPSSTSGFLKELSFLNNKSWMVKDKGIIQIGGDKENLMQILVKRQATKIFFLLQESPFLLEVIKL